MDQDYFLDPYYIISSNSLQIDQNNIGVVVFPGLLVVLLNIFAQLLGELRVDITPSVAFSAHLLILRKHIRLLDSLIQRSVFLGQTIHLL